MSTRRRNLTAGLVAVGIVTGGAVAASAVAEDRKAPTQEAPAPAELTTAQLEVLEAIRTDAPIQVQDGDGQVRGTVRDSALTARDARVAKTIESSFRPYQGPGDEEYDELFEALRILDPVPVVDAKGVTVGYWTHHFKDPKELEARTPEARATVDRLLGPGAGG